MHTINPIKGHLEKIAKSLDIDKPVTMLNLLRFRPQALKTDGKERTGIESYKKYSHLAYNFVLQAGGKVLFQGPLQDAIIGPDSESWDKMLIVEYPSFTAFCNMLKDPKYQAITLYRTAALQDSRLIPSQTST